MPSRKYAKDAPCPVPGCDRTITIKGLCKVHHLRMERYGTFELTTRLPLHVKFWKFVDRGGSDECWPWKGHLDEWGYGQIRLHMANQTGAHRASYALHFGDIPEGLVVRHKCNNPACVNPSHLILGTHRDNMQDRKDAGNYPMGDRAIACKYPFELVQKIRSARGTYKQIAEQFGVNEYYVGVIRRGEARIGS